MSYKLVDRVFTLFLLDRLYELVVWLRFWFCCGREVEFLILLVPINTGMSCCRNASTIVTATDHT